MNWNLGLDEEYRAATAGWASPSSTHTTTTSSTTTTTAAAATSAATAQPHQLEFHPRGHIIAWLRNSFEAAGTTSMTKEEIFADYVRECDNDQKAPLMASMFGKLVHRAFPGLRSSRLGARGQSKHCYKCLRRRSPTDSPTASNSAPSSTATETTRPRSATYPTSWTGPRSSLSSTILATVAHRRSRGREEAPEKKKPTEPRRNRLSTSSPWPSSTTCTTSSSTPPTSPTSSYYLCSLASASSPRTTCGSSPPQLVDTNWRPPTRPTGSVKSEGSSPLLHYAVQPASTSFVHPLGFGNNYQSTGEHMAHASSASSLADFGAGGHDEQRTRVAPPAYISPLEVDYFQLSDLSDFCPSPTYTAPTTLGPSATTSTPTSSWPSGVDDIERFRSFLTGLAHGDMGLPSEAHRNFGASTSPDVLFRQYGRKRDDSAGASPAAARMWLHPGLSLDTAHDGIM